MELKKNIYRVFSTLLVILGMNLVVNPAQALAQDTDDAVIEVDKFSEDTSEAISDLYLYEAPGGENYYFFSQNDKQEFINQEKGDWFSEDEIGPMDPGVRVEQTVVDTAVLDHEFLGYHPHTPQWARADSYSLTNSETFSLTTSFSYREVSTSAEFSVTTGVQTNIPVNNPQWRSRLGVYSDVAVEYIRNDRYIGNELSSTFYSLRSELVSTPTISVVYHPDDTN